MPIAEQRPSYTLYTPNQISVATLIGTPIAGALLLSANHTRLGEHSLARQTLVGASLVTVAVLAVAPFLPAGAPRMGIAIGLWVGMRHYAKQQMDAALQVHIALGGGRASNWTVAGVSLASLVVLILAALGAMALFRRP
jgi:hypothetical protein